MEPDIYRIESHGMFTNRVKINGRDRIFYEYIPEHARPCCAGVMYFCSSIEKDPSVDLLIRLAEKGPYTEQFIVAFLVPEGTGWNLEEAYGSTSGDVAYAMQVAEIMLNARQKYRIHEAKLYLLGADDGGTMAHMTALADPALFSGIASLGSRIPNPQYTSNIENALCTNFHGFIEYNGIDSIKKNEIPLPAWIIDTIETEKGDSQKLVDYYVKSLGQSVQSRKLSMNTFEYVREDETDIPVNRDRKAYAVRYSRTGNSIEESKLHWIPVVWDEFLKRQRRWEGDPGGDLRCTVIPEEIGGFEYHYEPIDGFLREWFVYVPEKVRKGHQQKVPLVLALHGYSCNAEIYIGNSGWHKAADEYGFIVVFPSATNGFIPYPGAAGDQTSYVPLPAWNYSEASGKPDEISFFRKLISSVCEKYPVDQQRIYATGHSHGSIMTHLLGMALTKIFAAVAPCSGTIFSLPGEQRSILDLAIVKSREQSELPCWMHVGEKEEWLLPHFPENGNISDQAFEKWCSINGLESAAELRHWKTNGKWNECVMLNSRGEPRVRYTWVTDMPHAVTPEISFRIWKEFFSHYSRRNGNIIFE